MLLSRNTRGRIQKYLIECLEEPDLRIDEQKNESHTILILAPLTTIQDDRGRFWFLRPLPVESQVRQYWFGMSALFEGHEDRHFRSVSMLLACGNDTLDPVPLARAECDAIDADHAQPHWHIYPQIADLRLRGLELVHWAMAARWALDGRGADSSGLTNETGLARWLGGCASYVSRQLTFLESRLPKSDNLFDRLSDS